MRRLEPEQINEYDDIYKKFDSSGFEFIRKNKHLGNSRIIFQDELSKIEASKTNNDDLPMLIYCDDCGCCMDYNILEGKDVGVYICPVCKGTVKELTLYNKLDRENERYLASIGKPEICKKCGGPWPDCESSCRMLNN